MPSTLKNSVSKLMLTALLSLSLPATSFAATPYLELSTSTHTPGDELFVQGSEGIYQGHIDLYATGEAFTVREFYLTNDFGSIPGDYDDSIERVYLQYEQHGVTEERDCLWVSAGSYHCMGLNLETDMQSASWSSSTGWIYLDEWTGVTNVYIDFADISAGADSGDLPAFKFDVTQTFNAETKSGFTVNQSTLSKPFPINFADRKELAASIPEIDFSSTDLRMASVGPYEEIMKFDMEASSTGDVWLRGGQSYDLTDLSKWSSVSPFMSYSTPAQFTAGTDSVTIQDPARAGNYAQYDTQYRSLSNHSKVSFWMKSSVDRNAGDIKFSTSGVASSWSHLGSTTRYDVPDLIAGEWQYITLDIAPKNFHRFFNFHYAKTSQVDNIEIKNLNFYKESWQMELALNEAWLTSPNNQLDLYQDGVLVASGLLDVTVVSTSTSKAEVDFIPVSTGVHFPAGQSTEMSVYMQTDNLVQDDPGNSEYLVIQFDVSERMVSGDLSYYDGYLSRDYINNGNRVGLTLY